MTELEQKIYEIVRTIPAGKVATYGRVAELAGNKKLSRVVGNTMHKNPVPFLSLAKRCGYSGEFLISREIQNFLPVPCHRVVASSGKMGANFGLGGPSIQEQMLLTEGVSVISGKVDLSKYSI